MFQFCLSAVNANASNKLELFRFSKLLNIIKSAFFWDLNGVNLNVLTMIKFVNRI